MSDNGVWQKKNEEKEKNARTDVVDIMRFTSIMHRWRHQSPHYFTSIERIHCDSTSYHIHFRFFCLDQF